jgi:hypothetical protein
VPITRIRHEVAKPAPYTPRTTSGDIDTKHSMTPRTMQGVDGAFKGVVYGNWIEHYKAPARYGPLLWAGTLVALAALAVLVVLAKT